MGASVVPLELAEGAGEEIEVDRAATNRPVAARMGRLKCIIGVGVGGGEDGTGVVAVGTPPIAAAAPAQLRRVSKVWSSEFRIRRNPSWSYQRTVPWGRSREAAISRVVQSP